MIIIVIGALSHKATDTDHHHVYMLLAQITEGCGDPRDIVRWNTSSIRADNEMLNICAPILPHYL